MKIYFLTVQEVCGQEAACLVSSKDPLCKGWSPPSILGGGGGVPYSKQRKPHPIMCGERCPQVQEQFSLGSGDARDPGEGSPLSPSSGLSRYPTAKLCTCFSALVPRLLHQLVHNRKALLRTQISTTPYSPSTLPTALHSPNLLRRSN